MGNLVAGRQQGACKGFFGVSNWLIMSDHVKGYPLNVHVLKRNEQESEKDKF